MVDLKRALELPPGDLRLEIAVTRAVLRDLLHSGLPPEEMLRVLETGSATLSRLLKTNKAVGGGVDDDEERGLRRALRELMRAGAGDEDHHGGTETRRMSFEC